MNSDTNQNTHSRNSDERLKELVRKQQEIIETQRVTLEELEKQREMILEIGDFPDELEEVYPDHALQSATGQSTEEQT